MVKCFILHTYFVSSVPPPHLAILHFEGSRDLPHVLFIPLFVEDVLYIIICGTAECVLVIFYVTFYYIIKFSDSFFDSRFGDDVMIRSEDIIETQIC